MRISCGKLKQASGLYKWLWAPEQRAKDELSLSLECMQNQKGPIPYL